MKAEAEQGTATWPLTIRTGGQTGVDRAALDVALEAGLDVAGWCPRGRKAEDGPLDPCYPLRETPTDDYAQRTEWNVRDADATLILARGGLTGGTELTEALAMRYGRPVMVVDPRRAQDVAAIAEWVQREGVRVLNVAGPRESGSPGIYLQASAFLRQLLEELKGPR